MAPTALDLARATRLIHEHMEDHANVFFDAPFLSSLAEEDLYWSDVYMMLSRCEVTRCWVNELEVTVCEVIGVSDDQVEMGARVALGMHPQNQALLYIDLEKAWKNNRGW